jgi:hypothetical protein
VFSYEQEAAVLHALPPHVRDDMAGSAAAAWLFGGKGARR